MAQIDPVPPGAESPEASRVFDEIRSRGEQPSPLYRTLAHSPGLLKAWAGFAGALRRETSLDRALAELVIMRLAQLSDAPYQWAYHWKPALAAGLTHEQLDSLGHWRDSSDFEPRQRQALAYAEAMFERAVGGADMAALRATFGTKQVLELTLTIGFYINVGRVLQALELDVDSSVRAFLP